MTAYLQYGDKIHITVPGDFGSSKVGQQKLEAIVANYLAMGIEVFDATMVSHTEQVTVVSVIRAPNAPKAPERPVHLKSVPYLKIPNDLRAHWKIPWEDPGPQEIPLRDLK